MIDRKSSSEGVSPVFRGLLYELYARLFLGLFGMFTVCAGLGTALMSLAFLDQWPPVLVLAGMLGGFLLYLVGRRTERRARDNALLREAARR